jgi:hypothetical protein
MPTSLAVNRGFCGEFQIKVGMPAGSALRSEIVTVVTARGHVQVARQEMRGLRAGSGWTWFWIARRKGKLDWWEASTAREAIPRATLLPPRKPPAWLSEAAADAERQIMTPPRDQAAEERNFPARDRDAAR